MADVTRAVSLEPGKGIAERQSRDRHALEPGRRIIEDLKIASGPPDDPAAVAAHSRKMYDRISGLANIGVWEFDLATAELMWTDTVYDLFEIPRGSPIERAEIVELYDPDSRIEMERLREEAISRGTGFALDIKIRTARGS